MEGHMPQDEKADDDLISSVDREIQRIPPNHSEACIFKVHALLREVNPKAYEPTILAIGPYHHGKDNLSEMQAHKLRYLQLLLRRRHESSAERYITAMRSLEEKARKCYANSINHLESDDFVKMMLLDGCFIIELFRKWRFKDLRDNDDPIFKTDWMPCSLRRDLMLFENQLPLFILVELDNMTSDDLDRTDNIILTALICLVPIIPGSIDFEGFHMFPADHLLGLMHNFWCSSFAEMVSDRNVVNQEEGIFEFMKSITELQEAGIQFKKSKENTWLFNIRFENGVMEIPPLTITDNTECAFRNLVAYEQYRQGIYPRCFSDYVRFIDWIVNSAKDAEKLGHYGIINNWLGDHEAIATMLNKLSDNIYIDSDSFCYLEVFNNVNKHCRRRRNIWLANLRRNYFNTPWAIISFLAALVLLLLTFIQTIFSIIS
uniref:Uncharacterized protein n=1 Tax=Davidia involucrata TaxID=16924 RepID=A0A5B7B2L5_DAVIN